MMDSNLKTNDHLWLTMIEDSTKKSNSVTDSVVLIVGDPNTGKNQLLKSLSANSDIIPPKSYSGLQYIPLEVYSEENVDEVYSHMNLYVMDGDDSFRYLLRYVLNQKSLEKMNFIVLLLIDLSKPYNCLESIVKWLDILKEQLQDTFLTMEAYNEMHSNYYQKYCLDYLKTALDVNNMSIEQEMISKNNIGIPVIVVGNKVDLLDSSLNCTDLNTDLTDFFLTHLRMLCLNYGLGIIFTDLTNPNNSTNNVALLYEYMLKIFYKYLFDESANIISKKSTFIPIGWDSMNKINIYKENISSINPDDEFSIHIRKPFTPTMNMKMSDNSVGYMEDAEFYAKLHDILARDTLDISDTASKVNQRGDNLILQDANLSGSSIRPNVNITSTPIKTNKTIIKSIEFQPGELANFFNTLLNQNSRNKTSSKK